MYFIHRNNKAHSIYKLRETFAEEQSETANLKVSAKQKIKNSCAEFPTKTYHSVSKNRVYKSAKTTFKFAKSTQKIWLAKKGQKKPNLAIFQK